jgi:UrcA family protein
MMNIQTRKFPLITGTKVLRDVMGPALLALGTATAALTPIRTRADDFAAHSERVSLAKLDLNSVEGARKAYARIKAAAFSVCGEQSMDIEVMVRGPGECVQGAIARAVLDVRSVELSKLYIKRNGIEIATLHGVTSPIVTAENSK